MHTPSLEAFLNIADYIEELGVWGGQIHSASLFKRNTASSDLKMPMAKAISVDHISSSSICSSDLPALSQPLRKQNQNQTKFKFLLLPSAKKLT